MSPPFERSWAKEAARDQAESAFTPILRRLLFHGTGVLGVCFVDSEGECIDYASALPPYDTKVTGAHLTVVISDLARRLARLGAGESWLLSIGGGDRELVVRRVSDDYVLIVILKPRALTRRMLGGIETAVFELRREAHIGVPSWEPAIDAVRVEVRDAVGWAYAPAAYEDAFGRVVIADVLGRWTEGVSGARVCFRVRTVDGEEITLVHDRGLDRWERHRDRDR